jgi:hypothetical protein
VTSLLLIALARIAFTFIITRLVSSSAPQFPGSFLACCPAPAARGRREAA